MDLINVDSRAVIEWLENRRKLGEEWPEVYKGIELKTKETLDYIKSLGYEKVNKVIDSQKRDLSYIELKEIFGLLEETKEAEQRSFFGSYKSRSLVEMKAVIKMLVKNNLHIVDLGKKLNQILVFDRPTLKKRVKANKKEEIYSRERIKINCQGIAKVEEEKQQYLRKLGLGEENLHLRIVQLVYSLPERIQGFLDYLNSNDTKKYLDYFRSTGEYLNPRVSQTVFASKILRFLLEHGDKVMVLPTGNTSKYDYKEFFKSKGYYNKEEVDETVVEEVQEQEWVIEEIEEEKIVQESILIDKESRGDLLSELQELSSFFTEKLVIVGKTDTLSTFDSHISELNKRLGIPEIEEAIKFFKGAISLLNQEKTRKIFGLLESVKAKERITTMVANFNKLIRKKRDQSAKCEDNLKELKQSTKEAQKVILKVNKRAKKLAKKIEEDLQVLMKHRFKVTGLGS